MVFKLYRRGFHKCYALVAPARLQFTRLTIWKMVFGIQRWDFVQKMIINDIQRWHFKL